MKHSVEALKCNNAIVEKTGEESLTVTYRATCCGITSACVCANLDVILGVQSLDKTGETVKETIRCSSLEGARGRESSLAQGKLTLFKTAVIYSLHSSSTPAPIIKT